MPIHLHPHTPLAERVLLPGDPGRAMRLATALIDGPKMFNHHRGLWGYFGPAKSDGEPLSVQSTGMGGPSAAIVVTELIELGARRLVRVGTCGGLDSSLVLGQLLVATEAIPDDGTSAALGAGGSVAADPELTAALTRAGTDSGRIVSTDLFYDAEDRHAGWRAAGARAVEMEAATVLRLAERHGISAACALIVSDLLGEMCNSDRPVGQSHIRIAEADLTIAELALGELAAAALSG